MVDAFTRRKSSWCGAACCAGMPCRRNFLEGVPAYSVEAYRRFMRRIWTVESKAGHLVEEWACDFDSFLAGVEDTANVPPTLRHRLVTVQANSAEDLITLGPGNAEWWVNSRG
jgi:hypothetical protein